MSVLKEGAYTVPSRVIGIYNYLIKAKGHQENREKLYQVLSPISLLMSLNKKKQDVSSNLDEIPEEEIKKDPHKMIKAVTRQCINMGLLIEDDASIKLNPEINKKDSLPSIVVNLFLSPDNCENHDFARVIAWYLAQNFYDAPGNWEETETQLRQQVGDGLLELNDTRYGQFEDWSCYLGFCWRNSLSKKPVLVPDPTVYLRYNLKRLFNNQVNQQLPLAEFINRLGKYCPIFETGQFREEIEQQIELREPNHLSGVTSIALRRLEDEGSIRLEKLSDAPVLLLTAGFGDPGISHITWLGSKTNGGQS
ncbi:protein DpdG [Leptolyngbya sp. FACHB-261]|uniref:protein DpdG n=1 Tax=Leptolyngbya sp. FACHB-261 TaxID=2692806 RepID=UPI001687C340|nr:protein DpdG [Leptolyngbya sp. FACHB-261]MBD2101019.1 hypothetical protein [Leptolyngbya sp. FACHB-261]